MSRTDKVALIIFIALAVAVVVVSCTMFISIESTRNIGREINNHERDRETDDSTDQPSPPAEGDQGTGEGGNQEDSGDTGG